MHRQSGLSIVELMIALLISSILLAGLIGLFLTARETRNRSQQLDRVADDARFFTTFIAHDIRMAGFNDNGTCSLRGEALSWNGSTLAISYCKPGQTESDLIEYTFHKDGSVSYTDAAPGKSLSPAPLMDGLTLNAISFGKRQSGSLQYVQTFTGSEFPMLKTVSLQFTLSGNPTPAELASDHYARPTFNFTVDIRNNNMQ